MNAIAKIIKVSTPAVFYWIRDFAKKIYQKPEPGDAILIEIDEMWHYLNSKKTNFGFGKHIDAKLANLLTGTAEDAI